MKSKTFEGIELHEEGWACRQECSKVISHFHYYIHKPFLALVMNILVDAIGGLSFFLVSPSFLPGSFNSPPQKESRGEGWLILIYFSD